jgi:hypothetical protein
MGTNHNLFHQTGLEKYGKSIQLFFGVRLMSKIFEEFQHLEIQTKIVQNFGIFFHQKSVSASRKKGFYTNRVPKKQEVGGIFV